MRIINARLFQNGRFQTGSISFTDVITGFEPGEGWDAGGAYVVPGFIDIHTHGAMGEDFSDGRAEALPVLSRYYAAHGVTSFCFTTMTLKEPELMAAMDSVRSFRRPGDGARCAGVHMEGPFLSYAKRGAQAPENLREPDLDLFRRANDRSGGQVRLMGRGLYAPGQGLFPMLTSGWYFDRRLLVSRGLTNSAGVPRLFNPCELILLHLEPKER